MVLRVRASLSSAICFVTLLTLKPYAHALRRMTVTEVKAARELHAKAGSSSDENTSYGQPVAELRVKLTSIDHFSTVYSRKHMFRCQAQLQFAAAHIITILLSGSRTAGTICPQC